MCEHCHGLSRRKLLKLSALATAAALTGCPPPPTTELPDPYEDQLEGEPAAGTTPQIVNPGKIAIPPPTPPQRTEYGDIMPRQAWTSSSFELSRAQGARPMDGVQRITLHHSGDGKPFLATSIPDTIRHLQLVREAHLQRGMIDIAYHFAVDRNGRVWQLRSLLYEGQHVRKGKNGTRWNEHNIGIVTLGDFDVQSPTVAQVNRLFAFVLLVRTKYSVGMPFVKMHGELVETDCPGSHLAPLIRNARASGRL